MKKKIVLKKVKKSVTKKVVKKAPVKKVAPVSLPVTTSSKTTLPAQVVAKPNPASNVQAKPVVPVKPAVPLVKRTLYVDVSSDKYFVLCDGRKLKSAKELADTLQLINDDMFKYHVTDTKNDFANWINDVFGESELAKKIKTIRNRLEMSVELYRNMFDKVNKK